MASIGRRGRSRGKTKPKQAMGRSTGILGATPRSRPTSVTTAPTPTTPAWKPAKSSVTSGNYGQAVSTAAHARNTARRPTGSAQPVGGFDGSGLPGPSTRPSAGLAPKPYRRGKSTATPRF